MPSSPCLLRHDPPQAVEDRALVRISLRRIKPVPSAFLYRAEHRAAHSD
ncbi:MAG: hypothetical protein ACREFQ_02690 [Stellaceae bacterium]